MKCNTRFFKPGSLDFWSGRPDQFWFFFKNQNSIVLVKTKNKSQRVATEFLTGFCRGQLGQPAGSPRVLTSSIFFKPGPILVPDRPDPRSTYQAKLDFKTMLPQEYNFIYLFPCHKSIGLIVFAKRNKKKTNKDFLSVFSVFENTQ